MNDFGFKRFSGPFGSTGHYFAYGRRGESRKVVR